MLMFYWELHRAVCVIFDAINMALHLTEDEKLLLLELHSGKNSQLRLLHYPPISKEQLENQIMARMPAHNDWRYVFHESKIATIFYCQVRLFVPRKIRLNLHFTFPRRNRRIRV